MDKDKWEINPLIVDKLIDNLEKLIIEDWEEPKQRKNRWDNDYH